MMIALLVITATTAAAIFANYTSSLEHRAVGHARREMQVRHLGASAYQASLTYIEQMGSALPQVMDHPANEVRRGQSYYEGGPPASVDGTHRLIVDQNSIRPSAAYDAPVGICHEPIETDPSQIPSLGTAEFYRTQLQFRIYDRRPSPALELRVGQRADGNAAGGQVTYYSWRVRAEARSKPPADIPESAEPGARGYHEIESISCGVVVSGPHLAPQGAQ